MSIYLPEEILLYYVLASDINEHGQSLRHLTITNISGKRDVNIRKIVKSNLRIFLNMIVPHFHELLLSRVDIREVIGTLDTQIESELEEAAKEIQKLEEEAAPDYGVGK